MANHASGVFPAGNTSILTVQGAIRGRKTTLDRARRTATRAARATGIYLLVNPDELKRQAAARALDYVASGMKLGLGTGSTARHFVELLGARVREGLEVIGVPTSETTRDDAI